MLEPLSPPTPASPEKKKKKKDKKRKEKERNRRSHSRTPPIPRERKCADLVVVGCCQSVNLMEFSFFFIFADSPNAKQGDDQALSESELESRRAALLAQLNMQMDE